MAVRREEERTTVDRYPGRVRVNHWVTAISLILLTISGAALFHPALFFMASFFGGGTNTRMVHPWIGVVLLASFAILFVQMVRYNFWAKVDTQWMRQIGDVMSGNEENLPEIGKYNGAQKLVFWLMTLLIIVLFVTGLMIWYEYFGVIFSIDQQRFAHIVHAFAAVAMLLVVIVHIYAGFYVRGTINAMTEGKVTGGWAYRHHRLWLRKEAREGVIDERQTPPRRHSAGPAE